MPADDPRSVNRQGLIYGTSAYLLWGAFPLYWPLLAPAGSLEMLAQRMAWSLVFVVILLRFTTGLRGVRALVVNPRQRWLLVTAATLVTVNWGVFLYGINTNHVVETSLGYFINPLFTILLGVVVLKERLRPLQWVAVAIGAVAILVITADYGHLPWIALVLAFSFGMYGYLKKAAGAGALESLTVETGTMFLPAVATLIVLESQGTLAFGHHGWGNSLLIMSSGVVTAVPLLLFTAGATRLPLSTLGLLQYLTPVLQFSVGVFIRHEPLPPAEFAGFVLVWIALVVLSIDGLRSQRAAAALAESASSVVT